VVSNSTDFVCTMQSTNSLRCDKKAQNGNSGKNCEHMGWDYNVPTLSTNYKKADVMNPKVSIQNALTNATIMERDLSALLLNDALRVYSDVSPFNVIDAVAMPILMLQQGVEAMEKVDEIADKIDADKRKFIIIMFFSTLFMGK
jgi:hypothetical protein